MSLTYCYLGRLPDYTFSYFFPCCLEELCKEPSLHQLSEAPHRSLFQALSKLKDTSLHHLYLFHTFNFSLEISRGFLRRLRHLPVPSFHILSRARREAPLLPFTRYQRTERSFLGQNKIGRPHEHKGTVQMLDFYFFVLWPNCEGSSG